jgi:peptide/nickel transport system substrate-binding protein
MHRTRWLTGGLALATGVGLLLAAALGATGQQRGGTLRLALLPGFSSLDPSVAGTLAIHNATQLLLLSFPDQESERWNRLVPHAAEAMPKVSRDGRTYTFTIRRGLRFSDGRPVTAANFAYSLNRALRPELDAYVAELLRDIVGADDVIDGRATTAAGIRASGRTLTIRLDRPVTDFPARLTMGNLGALPLDLPVVEGGIPFRAPVVSAGPYYVKEYVPRRSALLVRNPYWNRRALPGRPANVDAISYTFGLTVEQVLALVERGEVDVVSPPPAAVPELQRRFGVNESRLFIRPALAVRWLEFNHERPLFRDNVPLKRAINYAVDRAHLARQAGILAFRRTDQILPPTMPGFVDAHLYPLAGADVATARRLARGALRGGRAVLYALSEPLELRFADVVRFNLAQLGIKAEIRAFERPVFVERISRPGEPWDIALSGWITDYADPGSFLETFRRGTAGLVNVSAFDEARWSSRIDRAAALTGEERYAAFGALDRDLMREAAPVAPLLVDNLLIFTSARVGCVNFHPRGFVNYVALCLR